MRIAILLLGFISVLSFSSCEKNDLNQVDELELEDRKDEVIKDDKEEGEQDGKEEDGKEDKEGDENENDEKGEHDNCFELVFPIGYTMPDGSVIKGDDKESIKAQMKKWYEAHPDSRQKPELIFPVKVLYGDKYIAINNLEEMIRLKKSCRDDKLDSDDKEDRVRCIELIFPISMELPDGSIVTGDDKESLKRQIKAWYAAHPDSREKSALVYPVNVIYNGEKRLTLNNADEMMRLKKSCKEDKGDKEEDDKFDCPNLRADIGDDCYKDDKTKGTVTADCKCA